MPLCDLVRTLGGAMARDYRVYRVLYHAQTTLRDRVGHNSWCVQLDTNRRGVYGHGCKYSEASVGLQYAVVPDDLCSSDDFHHVNHTYARADTRTHQSA